MWMSLPRLVCFFFNDTATTEIYTLSLHDALPIWNALHQGVGRRDDPGGRHGESGGVCGRAIRRILASVRRQHRSEEHTSELQSRQYLVCRLLLEKNYPSSTMLSALLLSVHRSRFL